MARQITSVAPDPALLGLEREPLLDLSISVVTPLFGGSATPRETDARNPVRAASVRGHLRFWWRACQGVRYALADDLFKATDDLFKEEESVWGSTKHPSRLRVHVQTLDAGRDVSPQSRDYSAYALFPFQENRQKNIPVASGREGVRFHLRIGLVAEVDDAERAELQKAVEAAVWAWLTFGGIGARTRRGCGSLYCGDARFRPDAAEPGSWLARTAASHVATGERRLPISVVSGAQLIIGRTRSEPARCWKDAIDSMQSFRQDRGERANRRGYGRSLWPEAEAIREAWRGSLPDNAYFPRADLGLPIITHFKQNSVRSEPTDDGTLQANGKGTERMASPLILKPLALSPTQAVPLVLCLNAPHIWDSDAPGAVLSFSERRRERISRAQLDDPVRSAAVQPLRDNNASTARDAFMNVALSQLRGERVRLP